MLNGFVNVAIDRDLTDDIFKSLSDLAKKTICIGIPDSTEHENGKVTNADLMYIHTNGARDTSMIRAMQHDIDSGKPYSEAHELYVHENGSPLWNIPPRPILEPAMENSKDQMAKLMEDAVNIALEGGDISPALTVIGKRGESIAKEWFVNPENNWAPNSEITIHGSTKSKDGKRFIKGKGSDMPLIDTGQLRKSITYIIKDGDY